MRSTTHVVVRTAPLAERFRGRCILCGKEELTSEDLLLERCPNPEGLTYNEAVLRAVKEEQ